MSCRRSARLTHSKYFSSSYFNNSDNENEENNNNCCDDFRDDPDFVSDTSSSRKINKKRKSKVAKVDADVEGKQQRKKRKCKASSSIESELPKMCETNTDTNSYSKRKGKTKTLKKENTPTKNDAMSIEPAVNSIASTNLTVAPDDSDEDDEENWEEVEDADVPVDMEQYKPELPSQMKISLQKTAKEKNKQDWVQSYIRQQINRTRKQIQEHMHQTGLLLYIGRLTYLNSIANDETVRALVMSIIDKHLKLQTDLTLFVRKLVKWLRTHFEVDITEHDQSQVCDRLLSIVIDSFHSKTITSPLVFVLILIAMLRFFNLNTRICYLLNVLPIKPADLLTKKSTKSNSNSESSSSTASSRTEMKSDQRASNDWLCNFHWVEIFDESKQKWYCFDTIHDIYNDPLAISTKLDKEVSYILGIDNENFVSEITARYAPDWVSHSMQKRRTDTDWWQETLQLTARPTISKYETADLKEFDELMSQIDLPKRIADYKNHPLFVLQRDILKFQAIYPPDAPTLGFFREQPVYSRECVHTLKSRETWLRVARTVKPNETAYKVVNSKFKLDKQSGNVGKKALLELFGEWQTEAYVPPEAKDGIVPRNAYGNVELFQPEMLPKGTVHLKLPGLARIAAKLNIDCVPAVVGFDCNKHNYGAHPVVDGFVVCKEFQQILVDAWNEQQAYSKQQEEIKKEKRVLHNWKRLIKGLMIRRKLKLKYGHY